MYTDRLSSLNFTGPMLVKIIGYAYDSLYY